MPRQRPNSSLFPYTTLFRSRRRCDAAAGACAARVRRRRRGGRTRGVRPPAAGRRATGHLQRDRKSTRLNSSHLVISYAVFCLKEKKTKEITNDEFDA